MYVLIKNAGDPDEGDPTALTGALVFDGCGTLALLTSAEIVGYLSRGVAFRGSRPSTSATTLKLAGTTTTPLAIGVRDFLNWQNVTIIGTASTDNWGIEVLYYNGTNDVVRNGARIENLGYPYLIKESLTIDGASTTDTVRFAPGVRLLFQSTTAKSKLIVTNNGRLEVSGTVGNPVIFAAAGNGSWAGIIFSSKLNEGLQTLTYLEVHSAGDTISITPSDFASIFVASPYPEQITFTNVKLTAKSEKANYGIYLASTTFTCPSGLPVCDWGVDPPCCGELPDAQLLQIALVIGRRAAGRRGEKGYLKRASISLATFVRAAGSTCR